MLFYPNPNPFIHLYLLFLTYGFEVFHFVYQKALLDLKQIYTRLHIYSFIYDMRDDMKKRTKTNNIILTFMTASPFIYRQDSPRLFPSPNSFLFNRDLLFLFIHSSFLFFSHDFDFLARL